MDKNFIKKTLQIIKTVLISDIICQINIFKLKTTGEIIREKREKKGLLLRQAAALLDIETAYSCSPFSFAIPVTCGTLIFPP